MLASKKLRAYKTPSGAQSFLALLRQRPQSGISEKIVSVVGIG
jgi:hypothetical protein